MPHVAVFDTAFHATLSAEASTYAVPARWREEWGIRRYGFHGLAVRWAASQVRVPRLVVCHLGGGASVTGVLDGVSVDTTMGFTPLEGVPMATRSGSVDPGALLWLVQTGRLAPAELDRALEHESGLEALGGLDSELGFGVYTRRVAQAVAAAAVALGGLDAVVFGGGVGENRADVRDSVARRLEFLGSFDVEVVPAREELVVAADVPRRARRSGLAQVGLDEEVGADPARLEAERAQRLASRSTQTGPEPESTGATTSSSLSTRPARRKAEPSVGPPSSSRLWTPSAASTDSSSAIAPLSNSSSEPAGSGPRPKASRRGCRTTGTSRASSRGSSARTVPIPTATASDAARSSWTSRRASSPLTQRRPGTVTRPSSETATL